MTLVYLIGPYPSSSEGFIYNEIQDMYVHYPNIVILSLEHGQTRFAPDELKDIPLYYDKLLSFGKIRAHLFWLKQARLKYLSILWELIIQPISWTKRLKEIKSFSTAVFFLDQLKDKTPFHIHAHFLSAPSDVAILMSKLSGVPYSCSGHAQDIFTANEAALLQKITHAKFVVTCTHYNKQYLDALCNFRHTSNIVHLYHGIDLDKWPRKEIACNNPCQKETINILIVGRLVEKKGIIHVLDAFQSLRKSKYTFKCKIVGDGPLKESLHQHIQQHDLESLVSLEGAVIRSEIYKYYASADIFVLPSKVTNCGDRDGLPNVLLEAMAVGLPVVTTNVSAISELIIDGYNGLLLSQVNETSISEAIIQLIEHPLKTKQMIANARKTLEKFSIAATGQRLRRLIFDESKN